MSANFLRPLTPSQRELLELSRATTSTFQVPAPEGKSYLPFQLAGIEYGTHPAVNNVLLGDEPGLGKTVQAIGICNKIGAHNILVVCPAKLRGVWDQHFNDWFVFGGFVEIVSYNYLSDPLKVKALMAKGPFDVCIWDEVHNLKNQQAKRTKYALAKNGLISKIKKNICISGTPIQNRPVEVYPITKVMAPHAIDGMDKFKFGMRYCEGWKTPWGVWDFSGAANMKELGMRMRANWMVRRTKEKVLTELPAKFVNVVYVESKGGAKAVAAIEAMDLDTKIKGGGKPDSETHISSLREEVGLSKADFAIEYVKDQLESGHKKIFVVAHHKSVLDRLMTLSKYFGDVACIRGGMNDAETAAQKKKFMEDPSCRILVGGLQAVKEGHTLTAASYGVFVEFSWNPMENEQCMDRLHRIGQRDNVMWDFLVHKGSLDERMAKFCIEKSRAISEFGQ